MVPQILVETSPVALTIQVEDDPEYVPDELAEVASDFRSRLSLGLYSRLQRCNARLDVLSATAVQPGITDEAIKVYAQTDLDPANQQVAAILHILANLLDGFILDCVEGRLLCPGTKDWLTMD